MPTQTSRRRARPFAIGLFVVSSASVFVSGAAAQDSIAVKLARADSARARLVQPPGEYGGIRAMDVVRVPFQLFGAGLALGAAAAGGTYYVANKVLIKPALQAKSALENVDVDVGVGGGLGSRSWPGLILRYNGLSPLFAEVGYSLRSYQLYRAGVALGDEDAVGFSFEAAGAYRRLRQPHFWGVGPETRFENRSDYAQDVVEAGGTGRWRGADSVLSLSADAGWERSEVGRGTDKKRLDVIDMFGTTFFGVDEPVEYFRVGGAAEIDKTRLRDRHLRGFGALAEWHHYEGVGSTASSFEQVAGEARFFLPVNGRTVLALRVLAEDHLGESGQGVPFTYLARLGDDRGLRGYSGRRFRDLAMAAGQLEWRYEAYWHPGFPDYRVDAFAFVDAGTVAPSLSAIRDSQFHTTPGLGLRFLDKGRSKAEVYLSFGGDRTRAGLQIGSTF